MQTPLRWLLVLCALTFFFGLGNGAIADSDEAYYAEAARQMVVTGDWLTPYYNDTVRFQKPVMMYWLIAIGYLLTGVNEAAARFPSAVAGMVLVLLTFSIGRRWFNLPTGLLAGSIVATTFGISAIAWQALPDLPVTALIVFTTWSLLRALSSDPIDAGSRHTLDSASHRWTWLLAAAAAAAFACLTKGPIGIVLPAIVALPLTYWERTSQAKATPGSRLSIGFRPILPTVAVLLFLALAAPWFLAMAYQHGLSYLLYFFIGENITRFTTEEFNQARPLWFYIPVLAGGLLPWTPFTILWIPEVIRTLRTRKFPSLFNLRLIVWAAAPLIFYTVSVGKQPRYILPALTPLAILLARSIKDQLGNSPTPLIRASTALVAIFWLVLGGLFLQAAPIFELFGANFPWLPGLIMMSTAMVVAFFLIFGPFDWVLPTIATASAITLLVLHVELFSSHRPAPVEQVGATITKHWREGYRVGTYRAFGRNQVFYSGHPRHELFTTEQVSAFLKATTPVLCILPQKDWSELDPEVQELGRPVDQITYIDRASLRVRDLLQPNPENIQRTVLVVTNR
ncbi:MAG TPA: glycosyltransferase family 39 protein [Acidobacteria bacterium]|nr:glycosyltransferase family 39 protein [Nitrospirales bacterium]HIN70913.1 glycosyltransferase family 39 protein [Acidobacteriota bacterium]